MEGSQAGSPATQQIGNLRYSPRSPIQLKQVIHLLRGDLDWIAMKCLEEDRGRRYETANGLARDLERHLNNEPVVARPPSGAYRLQKFVRRNQVTVMAATLVAMALVLGLLGSVWEATRARTAEQQARRESARALGAEKTASEKSQIAEQNLYAADMSVAQRALAEHDLRRARTLLDRHRPSPGEPDLRGFEWRRLWQICQNDEAIALEPKVTPPRRVCVSADGRLIAASEAQAGPALIWDARSKRLLKTLAKGDRALTFAHTEPILVTGGSAGLKVWNTLTWSNGYLSPSHVEAAARFPETAAGWWCMAAVCRFGTPGFGRSWPPTPLARSTPGTWRYWPAHGTVRWSPVVLAYPRTAPAGFISFGSPSWSLCL